MVPIYRLRVDVILNLEDGEHIVIMGNGYRKNQLTLNKKRRLVGFLDWKQSKKQAALVPVALLPMDKHLSEEQLDDIIEDRFEFIERGTVVEIDTSLYEFLYSHDLLSVKFEEVEGGEDV